MFSSIAPTRPNYAKTAVYNVALLLKMSDRVHDLRLTWTNVSAWAPSIPGCNEYLDTGVLAARFVFSKPSVLGDPMDTPVNESDWLNPGGVAK